MSEVLRVAMVGTGPAACYAVEELRRRVRRPSIDVYERLLAPYGLVRSGVAPDHQRTKQVVNQFVESFRAPGVTLHLGVEVGRDLTVAQLRAAYDAVVVATGAPVSRSAGVAGEDAVGSHAVADLVGWYNGHPDHAGHHFDLRTRRAVVVGNGNVALDAARFLSSRPDDLRWTDVADHALDALAESEIEEVVVLGRRGVAQAAYSAPELIGLASVARVAIENDHPLVDEQTRQLSTTVDSAEGRVKQEITARFAVPVPAGGDRPTVRLRFLAGLAAVEGDPVRSVGVVRNRLVQDGAGAVRARATELREDLETGLVLHSVGFRGRPLPGLPFDAGSGTIPNLRGRVRLDDDGARVYVTGWIKRGPSGVIGSNRQCAAETVDQLLADHARGGPGRATCARPLPSAVPGFRDWQRIDRAERDLGARHGRVRVKLPPDAAREVAGLAGD